ncbi:uncharacterized protein LOC117101082 isoform X2 [Anneissia japonica]|uniref:uncharacterized protein LOC117101082 isoform X2 n=1 Tax=Anneissia japonica TaxID=1529436 RepID=UPI001425A180|nr:uncharacterized protein LOC117101082 isoform X2 [Anneissia japonica]
MVSDPVKPSSSTAHEIKLPCMSGNTDGMVSRYECGSDVTSDQPLAKILKQVLVRSFQKHKQLQPGHQCNTKAVTDSKEDTDSMVLGEHPDRLFLMIYCFSAVLRKVMQLTLRFCNAFTSPETRSNLTSTTFTTYVTFHPACMPIVWPKYSTINCICFVFVYFLFIYLFIYIQQRETRHIQNGLKY